MDGVTTLELERACRVLFGVRRTSLETLRADDWRAVLKKTFRRRAFETHPDRASALGRNEATLTAEFRELERAYSLIEEHLATPPRPARTPRRSAPRPSPARATAPKDGPLFYRGPMPRRTLRFGEFLYYSGVVSWQQLIASLAWQRRRRPRVGELAVQLGLMSRGEVDALLGRRAREGSTRPLAEWAVHVGRLTPPQRAALLARQRAVQPKLGTWFVENGVLTRERLEQLLHCARQMNVALDDEVRRGRAA